MSEIYYNVPATYAVNRPEAVRIAAEAGMYDPTRHAGLTWQGSYGKDHYLEWSAMTPAERKRLKLDPSTI